MCPNHGILYPTVPKTSANWLHPRVYPKLTFLYINPKSRNYSAMQG